MHTLWDCTSLWELVNPHARYWLALLKIQGVGFSLVSALTQVFGLLEHVESSLHEKLPVLGGP